MNKLKNNKSAQLLEGSRAIALTVNQIAPAVVAAYPITPQTHIVEDLAKFKADGQANYQYLLAESEFAAASIILGASAAGERVYSATSSQGLLLMTEVLFNISGLRLPIVMTVANRAVGAPINIWNDHSDAMAVRDAGWIMLFAADHQEAVSQHIIAYKIAEQLRLPVMVNVDGFILTHSYDSVIIPEKKLIKKFLPTYKPALGTYLNPQKPITIGAFFTPNDYWQERQSLHNDLLKAETQLNQAYQTWKKLFPVKINPKPLVDNGLIEYLGPKQADTLIIAMGSVSGTIKEVLKTNPRAALLRLKTYRPFPAGEIFNLAKTAKRIIVLEKAISPGAAGGPLYLDVKASLQGLKMPIINYLLGLGGQDISEEKIHNLIKKKVKTTINFS